MTPHPSEPLSPAVLPFPPAGECAPRADEGSASIAPNRAAVHAFHAAALATGGRDNGAPGLRPEYHQNDRGAFVLDADGHNIEAVCHAPG